MFQTRVLAALQRVVQQPGTGGRVHPGGVLDMLWRAARNAPLRTARATPNTKSIACVGEVRSRSWVG
jgi:hypothetical protein